MIPASERYMRDPEFKNLVDTIYHFMETLQLTPTEIREAVGLAAVKFESLNIRPILLSKEEISKYNLRMYGMENPSLAEYQKQYKGSPTEEI